MDTGAQVNLLPLSEINKLRPKPEILPCSVKLSAYNGSSIKVIGKIYLDITFKDKSVSTKFVVVEGNLKPIIGLNTCEAMNLIQRVTVVSSDDSSEEEIDHVDTKK